MPGNDDGKSSATSQSINITNLSGKAMDWKHQTNIYEVNLRQYTSEGTIRAFAGELPRLKEMGVQTLWFMPLTPIAKEKRKGSLGSYYACSDYKAVSPEFGTLSDFRELVKTAHFMGFKVILDWVANHTGWDHVWTKTHPDYYLKDSATGTFKIASGMDDIIELDYGNPKLREAMKDAMKFWVRECDIDGFRCDLATWVELDFWQQARPALDSLKPLFWLGEYDELDNPDYGKVFDASYTWTWMHQAKDYYDGKKSLSDLRALLNRYQAIGHGSMRAWFTTNHDENSWNGTEYEKYGDMALPLAVFSSTWDGIPLIYSGQELPLLKRLKFFEKDPIPWNGKYELQRFYKTLFDLKSSNPALRGGDPAAETRLLTTSADDKVLAYLRKNGSQEVLVLLNLSSATLPALTITGTKPAGIFFNAFTGAPIDLDAIKTFTLKPWEFLVLKN